MRAAIARVNTEADIQETEHSKVDIDYLLGEIKQRTNVEALKSSEYMAETHKL